MKLNEELKISIRGIFERPEYYGRKLNDTEVQEIGDNLASFGELFIQHAKNRYGNR